MLPKLGIRPNRTMRDYLSSQIDAFLLEYPTFTVVEKDAEKIVLSGEYDLNGEYQGLVLSEIFQIKIEVPIDFPANLPEVYETKTINNFPHKYANGKLCLMVDLELYIWLQNAPSLTRFFAEIVVPYLYSYKFYSITGEMPFGERSHGSEGVSEAMKEIFNVNDVLAAGRLLYYVVHNNKYRGHHLCPCGSGKNIRNCHAKILKEFFDHKGENAFSSLLNLSLQEILRHVESKNKR